MNEVTPQVFFVGETRIVKEGLMGYFKAIGLEGHCEKYMEESPSDGEALVEIAGRMCYRSFVPSGSTESKYVNPNVYRIREGNDVYIRNILDQKHGSILEHIQLNFIFLHVSRVFTHELVRHRAGKAYSQESLRYVRLTDLDFWMPNSILLNSDRDQYEKEKLETQEVAHETITYLERVQKKLASIWKIDEMKDFHFKKALTSMFRRFAPIGTATAIMASGNIRSMRHEISMRTSEGAEEEIRLVFNEVAKICQKNYSNFFQDMSCNSNGEWKFENEKV